MKRLLIIFTLLSTSVFAQDVKDFLEVGVSANSYKGDLSSSFQKWSSSLHLGYKTNIKKRVNVHLGIFAGSVVGQNPTYTFITSDNQFTTPNRYFKSKISGGNIDLHINLYKSKNIIVYLSQGVGLLRFKVLDENNENLLPNYTTRESNETYSNTTFTLPTNLGVIYVFSNGFGAGVQGGFLNGQSDYIDNISTWGSRAKKDNMLSYKFTFYIPFSFIKQKENKIKPQPTVKPVVEVMDDDKDGVENGKDACPQIFGPANNSGCPLPVDTDNDGIVDEKDQCPTVFGIAENQGCPAIEKIVDSDNDSIPDNEDNCPEIPGIITNKGCPEMKKEDVVLIDKVKETLVFETGKATILPTSYPALDAFAKQLIENIKATVHIEGHTDSTGVEESNLLLSEERAQSVKRYLVTKGITEDRIKAMGLGSKKPIASNQTEEGKAQNRRVEIIIIYNEE